MANEVEDILREIRERVRAEEQQRSAAVAIRANDQRTGDSSTEPTPNGESREAESLARLSAHLTTTARAWDRLPPVSSNRSGAMARLELWIKARFKTIGRWFTWEQVNFNAAVHQALTDTLALLSAHEQQLIKMRAEAESWRAGLERTAREIQSLRAGIEAHAAQIRKQDAHLETLNRATDVQAAEMSARFSNVAAEMSARLSELSRALRECDERLREEQRVCFKQLSLEVSEAAVLEDRTRRAIETRLEKLEKTRD